MEAYRQILIFAAGGVIFLMATFMLSYMLRPNKPNNEKLSTYESGEEPIGNANTIFNPRFVLFALLFVLFEVEVVLLYPLAVVYGSVVTTWLVWCELVFFAIILGVALAYAWKNNLLEWEKPSTQAPISPSRIPENIYAELKRAAKHKI